MKKGKTSKPRRLKASQDRHHSFTLADFILIDKDGVILSQDEHDHVIQYLTDRCELMQENENHYYQHDYQALVQEMTTRTTRIGKFKQAKLRKYVPAPYKAPADQPYNFTEMLRQNIGNKLDIYTQREIIQGIITSHPDWSAYQVQQEYINQDITQEYPSVSSIKKYAQAIKNTGSIHSIPHGNGQLPLGATDGHYHSIDERDGYVRVGIKIEGLMRYLVFRKPKGHDATYYHGRVTAPTIRLSKNGNLVFDFAVVRKRPRAKSLGECAGVLGVDSGIVHEFVASFVRNDGTCSQPFVESGAGVRLKTRMDELWAEIDRLEAKAVLCGERGWFEKADVLWAEAVSRREAVSRLKRERAVVGAREVVGLALVLDAAVCLEDLSWVPDSHWDQAAFKSFVSALAADVGVPVFRVSAAGSSRSCARDGGSCAVSGSRFLSCSVCGRVLDRDVSASRVLACRGLGRACVDGFLHFSVGSRGHRAFRVFLARLASCGGAGYEDVSSIAVSSPLVAREGNVVVTFHAFPRSSTD